MPDRPFVDPELAAEQAYVDAAYARLEAMRAAAERVRAAYSDVRAGGTHQARLERDIAWNVTQRRLSDLDIGDAPLMFGRLDMEDHSRWYVGRIAVEDEEHTPLVVDWRAPVSEPFYRATAVEPMAVVRRRHLISKKGRELVGLDDEVFDQEAIDAAGLPIAGEGALLAALERNRTGRMGDIVATIQAEQDEAIRADLPGPLVVAGGPGTGKTAVALHRAAYLLYTFRRRLGAQGVLLVGPSPVFLRYIEHVLPSLGEQDAALDDRRAPPEPEDTRNRLGCGRRAEGRRAHGARHRARGRRSGAAASPRLHAAHRRPAAARAPPRDRANHRRCTAGAARTTSGVRNSCSASSTCSSRATRKPRSARTTGGPTTLPPRTCGASSTATTRSMPASPRARAGRGTPRRLGTGAARTHAEPPRGEGGARPHVARALGPDLVNDLFGFTALVRSAARDLLTDEEQALLHRARARDIAAVAWTEDDVALVDEADSASVRSRRRDRGIDERRTATKISTARPGSSTSSASTASPTRPASSGATRSRSRTDPIR